MDFLNIRLQPMKTEDMMKPTELTMNHIHVCPMTRKPVTQHFSLGLKMWCLRGQSLSGTDRTRRHSHFLFKQPVTAADIMLLYHCASPFPATLYIDTTGSAILNSAALCGTTWRFLVPPQTQRIQDPSPDPGGPRLNNSIKGSIQNQVRGTVRTCRALDHT